jgi:uncharacterized protein involved in exopolysaccharide biosynthesis
MNSKLALIKKPVDYIKIFFRRKWLIIIPVVMGIAAGLIAGNVMPKIYEASTLILVEEGRVINPLIQGLAVSTSTAQRIDMLREQILGWDRMLQLIRNLDLAKDVKNQVQFEALVKCLRRDIKVRLQGPNVISIYYQGPDPIKSQEIVKNITDIFIAENLRQKNRETEDAVAFINDQVALYQKKLKQSEISAMEDQLQKLSVDSTNKHPMVIELKRKIESARQEMAAGNYDVDAATAAANPEMKSLKDDLKQIREEITSADQSAATGANRVRMTTTSNEKLYKLLLLERLDKVEARDATVNQKLYNELLSRLETAKITQRLESSKEGTRYTILDPARLPLKPIRPNKLALLFGGLFFGLCAGTALVFIMEMLDRSFLGVDEAKAYLELPMLGAVSKIVTQADIQEQRIRRLRLAGISVVLTVVLVIAIVYNVIISS